MFDYIQKGLDRAEEIGRETERMKVCIKLSEMGLFEIAEKLYPEIMSKAKNGSNQTSA